MTASAALALAMAMAALAACGRGEPGGPREEARDANRGARRAARDAIGPLDRVRDRFDRACPPSTPRYPLASMIAITKHPRAWVCSMPSPLPAVWPAVWPIEAGAPALGVRHVVSLALIDRAGEPAVRAVAVRIQDERAGAARPAACDGIVDELVAYVDDLLAREPGARRAALDARARGATPSDLASVPDASTVRRAIEVRDEDGFCEAHVDARALASPE